MSFFDSSSNTSTKTLPIILRFASGSDTPASSPRKRLSASTRVMFKPNLSPNISMTWSPSCKRSKPLSTNTQCKFSPIARCKSNATTEESTPPDKPKITSSSPTCSLMRATASSIIFSAVHFVSQPQIFTTKLVNNSKPFLVWVTSGWNCTP